MLDQSEVASYLLHRELISGASIVDSDLVVMDVSRRNRNFKVTSQFGPSYLLKQSASQDGSATLAYESGVYQLLHELHGDPSLQRYLPRHYAYDKQENVLILELLRNAPSLQEHHAKGRFSTALAAALGLALSKFHRLTGSAGRNEFSRFSARMPWVLSLHRPSLEMFRDISNANLQLIRIVQNAPEFQRVLDQLRQGWRVDSLIHNDLKWDNCLVCSYSKTRRAPELKIVDWEFAGMGDACWDAGAIFSNYLSFWLNSIPVTGEDPPDRFLELARYPLERMQPAIRRYWKAYVRGMGFEADKAHAMLLRSTKYAAARLIQTGFEQMQNSVKLTGNLICLLQLSLNMMLRPHEAIAHLLGIPLGNESSAND